MKLLYYIFNDVEYEIRVGQNKHENWELLDDADPNDLWFHVANASSAYVVLSVVPTHTVQKPVITYCAELCQAHSKMKHETKCRVMYTQIRNVAKGKHIGEALVSDFNVI